MLWNVDVVKMFKGKLEGRGTGYDSYVYRMPYSQLRVTLLKDEYWLIQEADEKEVQSGFRRDTLFTALQKIEEPLRIAHEAEAARVVEEKRTKEYRKWIALFERLVAHIVSDAAKDGITLSAELVHKGDSANQHCPSVELTITHDSDTWRELWCNFDEAGKPEGSTNGKPFKSLPGFKKAIANYYPNFNTKA